VPARPAPGLPGGRAGMPWNYKVTLDST